MSWYTRIHATLTATTGAWLRATQVTNLALLVSAILAQRTLTLAQLARAYPLPPPRPGPGPKHGLHHRIKRLWRFLDNPRVDPLAVQAACLTPLVCHLLTGGASGPNRRSRRALQGRWLGLAVDWTMFDAPPAPGKPAVRYQVLTIAVPRRGRTVPLLQVAYDRDHLPPPVDQRRLERQALATVFAALPPGVRPVVLADRGFGNAWLLAWLQQQDVDYVLRLRRGVSLTEPDGTRWFLGRERLRRGEVRWHPQVQYGVDRRYQPLLVNVVCCWREGRARARTRRRRHRPGPAAPWYLATSLPRPGAATAWYAQRTWLEATFKDAKSRFGLDRVALSCPARLNRLLLGLTLALAWLALLALPEIGALRRGVVTWAGWRRAIQAHGTVSLLTFALEFLTRFQRFPAAALPRPG